MKLDPKTLCVGDRIKNISSGETATLIEVFSSYANQNCKLGIYNKGYREIFSEDWEKI